MDVVVHEVVDKEVTNVVEYVNKELVKEVNERFLMEHFATLHSKDTNDWQKMFFICEICGKVFTPASNLASILSPPWGEIIGPSLYQLWLQFDQNFQLKRHKMVHTGPTHLNTLHYRLSSIKGVQFRFANFASHIFRVQIFQIDFLLILSTSKCIR